VPGGGGDHSSRAATFAARERERNVVELCLRGATFEQIGRQLNIDRSTAYKAWDRALKRLPKADVEAMRKMESERIRDLRFRIWNELAGRPDPNDPAKTVRPEPGLVIDLVDKAIKIARHEARLFGLDTPSTQQVASPIVGQPISDEELDRQLARLTEEEMDTFMRLTAKLQGRWVEPPPPPSIETTRRIIGGSRLEVLHLPADVLEHPVAEKSGPIGPSTGTKNGPPGSHEMGGFGSVSRAH